LPDAEINAADAMLFAGGRLNRQLLGSEKAAV